MRIGLFMFISILLFSCKKDIGSVHTMELVTPRNYFPAFPGSYWVYDNGDTMKVVDNYEAYIFNSAQYTGAVVMDTLILPKLILNGIYNGSDEYAYVNGYSISKESNSDYKDPAFKGILSLTEGANFTIGGAIQNHQITGKTVKVDTSISIGNITYENVIMTIRFDEGCTNMTGSSPEECATLREYYAKDVGLIKRESKNGLNESDYTTEIELVNYYIND